MTEAVKPESGVTGDHEQPRELISATNKQVADRADQRDTEPGGIDLAGDNQTGMFGYWGRNSASWR